MHGNHLDMAVLVIGLGVAAQWLAWRFRVPAIVLFTAAGILAGPVLGVLDPAEDLGPLFEPIIKLGVAVILFEGGLNLRLHELRTAARGVARLVLLGVPIAWMLGAAAAYWIGGLSGPVALVLGAIIVVTGPTVIMPLLKQARLGQHTASLLKWEGIVNDPIGALLAVLVFEYFVLAGTGNAAGEVAARLAASLAAAGGLGAGLGAAVAWLYRHGHVPEYLKGPVMFTTVLVVFAAANAVQDEAGLLAVTVFGVILGNSRLPSIDELRRFKEYLTVLLVSSLFVLLTAELEADALASLDLRTALMLAAIVFVVRPLTVMLATLGAGLDWRERVFLGWIAPRGVVAAAVAGAFAPTLVELGHPGAEQLVPLVFALIIVTVVLHGFTIGWLARRLGLAAAKSNGVLIVGASPWSVDLARLLQSLDLPVRVVDASWHRLRPARLAGLPVYYGQVISESAEQALDLSGFGYLVAGTDNDAYNALVCTRFANELGRNRVFQLPIATGSDEDVKGVIPSLRGRQLAQEWEYEEVLRKHFQGWRFQRTRLTEDFPLQDYLDGPGRDALLLMSVDEEGELAFATAARPLEPEPGETLIALAPARPVPGRQR